MSLFGKPERFMATVKPAVASAASDSAMRSVCVQTTADASRYERATIGPQEPLALSTEANVTDLQRSFS